MSSTSSSLLPFRVVCCSSEMDHAPAIELQLSAYRNTSGIENAGGYQSGEFPDTPIEIGLHVGTGSIYIDSVTFLIHRYKIPSKVEVFYGSYGSSKEDDEYLANIRNYKNNNNNKSSNPTNKFIIYRF